jgi:hypothetical protein
MRPAGQTTAVDPDGGRTMGAFDYGMEAALFIGKGTKLRRRVLEYRRFVRAAEAIRFAIEDLPPNVLGGCSLEVGEDRYVGAAIRWLYERVDFPLLRHSKPSK